MTERKHVENALNACANAWVPEMGDPWPEVRDRALAGRRRSSRQSRFVPRTRVGWVVAALLVMLFSTGAYAGSGLLYEMFRSELPGAEGAVVGQKLNEKQTADDTRVTLEWAYADSGSVVVGFGIQDLSKDRRVGGYPVKLEPVLDPAAEWYDESGAVGDQWPDDPRLTSTENIRFDSEGTTWQGGEGAPSTVVFVPSDRLEPGQEQRLRLEVPVQAWPQVPNGVPAEDRPPPEPVGERPFVFDFEIPVKQAPVVLVNQRAEANGVALTLKRVVDSPGRPQAVICFEPPDGDRNWIIPDFEGVSVPGARERNCREILLRSPLEGRATVTVERLEGFPRPGTFSNDREFNERIRTICGPWTFEFEVPER